MFPVVESRLVLPARMSTGMSKFFLYLCERLGGTENKESEKKEERYFFHLLIHSPMKQ